MLKISIENCPAANSHGANHYSLFHFSLSETFDLSAKNTYNSSMREWNLKQGDPLSLTLSADARLSRPDYVNDQIWELSLSGGDPPAMALQTTYGLRARNMRIFPRFGEGDTLLSNPGNFHIPPAVKDFHPSYILATYSPFPGIDVAAEYWVPQSDLIAGRLQMLNSGTKSRQIRLEWVAALTPGEEGQLMAPVKMEAVTVLQGKTDGLYPVVFMTGGPHGVSSPYPSLILELELLPGQSRRLTWVHAGLEDPRESFLLARQTATRKWDAELARVAMTNASNLEVHTGDPDWDAAFALGQKVAYSLFHPPSEHLPHPSFVFTRQPDLGFSPRGDGGDYTHLWNGQPALESWYLAGQLLPAAPQLAQGLLRNFLAVQSDEGFIDWKPGLAGQRSRMLAMPLLASLAWRIYSFSEDRAFLEETLSPLLDFFHTWFNDQNDRDGDGLPEWGHPMQTGFDENPAFSLWQEDTQGADLAFVESPALCALLYKECQTLIQIAKLIQRPGPVPALEAIADNLRTAVESSWDGRATTYRYWDRETHLSSKGETLGQRQGPGDILVNREFETPVRLLIRIDSPTETTRHAHAFIHGNIPSGHRRVERVARDKFHWLWNLARCTTDQVYQSVERVQIQGIQDTDTVTLLTVDLKSKDHTLLLPVWAGIPAPERVQKILDRSLLKPTQYGRDYGIPACPSPPSKKDVNASQGVWMPWNELIGLGLLDYGHLDETVVLVTRLMSAVVHSLKTTGAFYKQYHADTAQGMGERNALAGLPPLGLFMEVLGVRILSPWRVFLKNTNPFPWPVTLKFRGLMVKRKADLTLVTFPDGQSITVTDPAACIVDGSVTEPQTESPDEDSPKE